MTLGVELRDASVIAVAIDEVEGDAGRVLARAAVDSHSSELSALVAAAIDRVAPSAADASFCLAAWDADSPTVSAVLESTAARHPHVRVHPRALGCGTAAAIAESWIGAARGVRHCLYFAADVHTTAGIVHDGRPSVGAHGREPAVGWLALNPVEREDYRKSGGLEAEVAAAGIVRRLIWRVKAGDQSRVADSVNGNLSAITYDLVVEGARAKDGVSISVMRDTAKYLGMAAANLVLMTDPTILVLGGIMASAGDLLLEPIVWELSRRLPGSMMDALKIAPAALGADAAAIGAARHAAISRA